jgi:hypothetical protein
MIAIKGPQAGIVTECLNVSDIGFDSRSKMYVGNDSRHL